LWQSLDDDTIDRAAPQQSYNAERTKILLTETMLIICTGHSFDAAHKQEIAMNSLIPAHHPNLSKLTMFG
jgi:hypothetical protein